MDTALLDHCPTHIHKIASMEKKLVTNQKDSLGDQFPLHWNPFGELRFWLQYDGWWCRVLEWRDRPPRPFRPVAWWIPSGGTDLSSSAQTHHQRQKYLSKQCIVTVNINFWHQYPNQPTYKQTKRKKLYLQIKLHPDIDCTICSPVKKNFIQAFQIFPNLRLVSKGQFDQWSSNS